MSHLLEGINENNSYFDNSKGLLVISSEEGGVNRITFVGAIVGDTGNAVSEEPGLLKSPTSWLIQGDVFCQ
jgi:hypothetical protein